MFAARIVGFVLDPVLAPSVGPALLVLFEERIERLPTLELYARLRDGRCNRLDQIDTKLFAARVVGIMRVLGKGGHTIAGWPEQRHVAFRFT